MLLRTLKLDTGWIRGFIPYSHCAQSVMTKHRRTLGVVLLLLGLSLVSQLSVALMPMHHPLRVIVQLLTTVLITAAALALYHVWPVKN